MLAGAELHDLTALAKLRLALNRFRSETPGVLTEPIDRRIRAAEQMLFQRRQVLRAELASLREELRYSDEEDDRGRILDAIESVSSDFEHVTRRMVRLEQAAVRFKAARSSLVAQLQGKLAAAIAFLGRKEEEAREYAGTGASPSIAFSYVSSDSTRSGSYGTDVPATKLSASDSGAALPDPTRATIAELPPLPDGMAWIPLDRIDSSELPSSADYKKVSYTEMRQGLERFWLEMLPAVKHRPRATRETFAELDRELGRVDPEGFVHPASLANLYDKLLSRRFKEHIRVADAGGQSTFSIDNGRHRIRVAIDLGWTHVPGEVVSTR